MKTIEWLTNDQQAFDNVDKPSPSKKYIPAWYKKILKFEDNNNKIKIFHNLKNNITVKSCVPFLDSLTAGYIQETWCDIYIEKDKNNNVFYTWSMNPQIMDHKDKVTSDNLINNIFYHTEFTWKIFWMPKLPKNYSMLFVHPLNRIDLPFYSLSGIIDSDVFYENNIGGSNLPFYIKKDFQGIIPAGTPMYQMIPIKRDRWSGTDKKINNYKISSTKKYFFDGYKKIHWKKKEYN